MINDHSKFDDSVRFNWKSDLKKNYSAKKVKVNILKSNSSMFIENDEG